MSRQQGATPSSTSFTQGRTLEEIPPWLKKKFQTEFPPSMPEPLTQLDVDDLSRGFQALEIRPEVGKGRDVADKPVVFDAAVDANEGVDVRRSSMTNDSAIMEKRLLQAVLWGYQEGLKSSNAPKSTTMLQAQADASLPSAETPNSQGYTSWVEKRQEGNQLVINFFSLDHKYILVRDITPAKTYIKTKTVAHLNISPPDSARPLKNSVSGWANRSDLHHSFVANEHMTANMAALCNLVGCVRVGSSLDKGVFGRYHDCHAEKKVVAQYLVDYVYERGPLEGVILWDAKRRDVSELPRATIFVSRKVCWHCRYFIGKVEEYYGIKFAVVECAEGV